MGAADVPFSVEVGPRAAVQAIHAAIVEELHGSVLEGDDPELRVLHLDGLSAVQINPAVKSSGIMGRVELVNFKHDKVKSQFEVSFKIQPAVAEQPILADETQVTAG